MLGVCKGEPLAGAGAVAAGRALTGSRLGFTFRDKERPRYKHKRAIAMAITQVPFSSTSVVCFTPMNWVLNPAMLPANPPPLGFWIRMNKRDGYTSYNYEYQEQDKSFHCAFNCSILVAK